MTVRLHLICHAPGAANRAQIFGADEPLDEFGLKKLARVAAPSVSAARIFCSPALQAVQTASALGFDALPEPLLRDCDYGSWAGLSLDDVYAQHPDHIAQWLQDAAAAPHGGESIVDLISRAGGWLDSLQSSETQDSKRDIIAITHASVIRAAIVSVLGAPASAFWRIDIAPLSLTRLSGHQMRWNLSSLGDLPRRSTRT